VKDGDERERPVYEPMKAEIGILGKGWCRAWELLRVMDSSCEDELPRRHCEPGGVRKEREIKLTSCLSLAACSGKRAA
jgi:hypothetical protein